MVVIHHLLDKGAGQRSAAGEGSGLDQYRAGTDIAIHVVADRHQPAEHILEIAGDDDGARTVPRWENLDAHTGSASICVSAPVVALMM